MFTIPSAGSIRQHLLQSAFSTRYVAGLAAGLAVGAPSAFAINNEWTGATSTAWNEATNWSENRVPQVPNGQAENFDDAVINITPANIATISQNILFNPRDFIVGRGGGSNGRLDHTAGVAIGNGWGYVGTDGGTGLYNLADVSSAPGGVATYAQGSGSLEAGNFYVGGFGASGSNGTANVNTTGTLEARGEFNVGSNGSTGVLNLETGSVLAGNWFRVGGGAGGDGTVNMAGGTINKQGAENFAIGINGGTGEFYMTGGEITANNELWVGNGGGSNGLFEIGPGCTVNNGSWCSIGRAGGSGELNMTGGQWNANTGGGNFIVGDGATGVANVSDGLIDANNEFWVGQGGTGDGTLNLSGSGAIQTGSWVAIGRGGGSGTVNMTGGTFLEDNGGTHFIIGTSNGTGEWIQSGGETTIANNPVWLAENDSSVGTLTLSGTGIFTANDGFIVARDGATTGTLNLDGGTFTTRWLRGGAGTSTANFDGANLVGFADEGDFLSGLQTTDIQAGGLTIDSAGFSLTGTQVLDGTGGLTKVGAGSVALTGAHGYSGPTSVSAGSLTLGNIHTGTGDLTVADGAALGLTEDTVDSQYSPGNATFDGVTTATFNLTDATQAARTNALLNVPGTLTLNGDLTINVTDVEAENGSTVPLIAYAAGAGVGAPVLGSLPEGVVATLQDDGSLISLDVTFGTPLVWDGDVSGVWDFTDANWAEEVAPEIDLTYTDGRWVLFDDFAFGTTNVTLDTTVTPYATLFNNPDGTDYTLGGTGDIAGTGELIKRNTGTTTISTANTYTGATRVEGGLLSVATLPNGGVAGPIGASTSDAANLVLDGGTLGYTGATTTSDRGFTIAGTASGIDTANDLTLTGDVVSTGGSFHKLGSGNLTLPQANLTLGANQISEIRGGTLTFPGTVAQTVSSPGQLWIGSIPDASGNLALTNTDLTVGSWLTIGRGTGDTGVLSTLTATGSTIECTNLSAGFDADLGYNDADQTITLIDTDFTNNGIAVISERQNNSTTITLSGDSTYTSAFRFQMALNATASAELVLEDDAVMTLTGEWFSIGNDGTGVATVRDNAVLTKTGGSINIGDVGTSDGTLNIQDNAVVTADSVVFVGKNGGTTGIVNMDGGTFNTNTYITIGRQGGATGTFNLNGGVVNQTDVNAGIAVGEQGNGTLNVNGGTLNIDGGGLYLTTENTATGVAEANLNGGTVSAKRITERDDLTGTSTLNLNGGLIQARAGAALAFIANLDQANVLAGGALIDSNGQTIAVSQDLLDGGGGGGLTKSGAGFLQLNGTNTYTGTTSVTAGELGGTGSVAGPLVVDAAATLAPGASAGTFTAGDTTLGGTYLYEIDGATGDSLVVNGNLDLTGGTLAITELAPGTAATYVVATYTGTLTGNPFTSVVGLPAGWSIDYGTGSNSQITLTNPNSDPYNTWIDTYFPGEVDPLIIGKDADPDSDGQSNLVEFGLGGNPDDAADNARIYVLTEDSDADVEAVDAELLMTIAVRAGTPAFSAGGPNSTASHDGVDYSVEGSLDLVDFLTTVNPTTTAVTTDLPGVPSGYEYRTFSLDGSNGLTDVGFLRAELTETP